MRKELRISDRLELGTYAPYWGSIGRVLYLLPRDTFLAINYSEGYHMTVHGGTWEESPEQLVLQGVCWDVFSDYISGKPPYGQVAQVLGVRPPPERLVPLAGAPQPIVRESYSYRGEKPFEIHTKVTRFPPVWIVDSCARALALAEHIDAVWRHAEAEGRTRP